MSEKQHSLVYENNLLTVKGVTRVVSVSEKEAELRLDKNALFVKGTGLNVCKLDKEQGVVVLETQSLSSISYRHGGAGLKGLFR